ncbi:hypothetical protein C0992_000572 [Termitomyces sp. T32_za158]|nr:hypothetical protein C0992_000572 [Termitomyces sp. T32_za158]
MQRGASYRKPVPIYIPSPPGSPALLATQLPHSLENDAWSQVDMQNVLQQTQMPGADSVCISNTAVNGTTAPISADEQVPSFLVKSPEGEEIPLDDSNYTPLTATCSSPGRRVKRKLHREYRPPTPPLPSHSRKHPTRDTFASVETPSSSIFNGHCESLNPELRRKPSTVAPSFTTSYTQSPSFQTERTYLSFVPSNRCIFWPKKGNVRLQQIFKSEPRSSRSGLPVDHGTEADEEVSWWGKICEWGVSMGVRVKRLRNMRMERDSSSRTNTLSRRDFFHACLNGTAQRPAIPRLRSDPPLLPLQPPHTLQAFRDLEGRENRKRRLQELWKRLPQRQSPRNTGNGREKSAEGVDGGMSHAKAEKLRAMYAAYDDELLGHCGALSSGVQPGEIPWKRFKEYAEAKEVELWSIFHDELDLDGDGHLDEQELSSALNKAGEYVKSLFVQD